MDNNIPEIEELIRQFSKLPGLGPKSAKRIILKLFMQVRQAFMEIQNEFQLKKMIVKIQSTLMQKQNYKKRN